MAVHYERIPSTDPRLARHVRHDDRSWDYRFNTEGLSITSVVHPRRIPILDQGQIGSCTGNAAIGCMGSDPFYATVTLPTLIRVNRDLSMEDATRIRDAYEAAARGGRALVLSGDVQITPGRTLPYTLDEAGALKLYSDAETIDGDGPYPPNDNGSSGLSVAQALKNAGQISGYTHTFNLDDALKALGVTPYITGVSWYSNMFDPDQDGRVYPTGTVAGGHEFVADEIDAENQQVWFTNSWGSGWGVTRDGRPGRFYMTFADYGDLLSQQGDVTIFTPLTQPAPTPTPPVPPAPPAPGPVDADRAFAAALRAGDWLTDWHVGETSHVRDAATTWLQEKGL